MAPTYDSFVFDEIRRIGRAWRTQNPDSFPAHVTDGQIEHLFEKIGDMSWRRLVDKKPLRQIFEEIGVNPSDYGEDPPSSPDPQPPADTDLSRWPRLGLSIASVIVSTACDLAELTTRYQDLGVETTRINLLSALWPGVDCLPFRRQADGQWDLYDWNTAYFDRLVECRERMNAAGIVVQWTNYELYSWSRRKLGPQQENTPWRHNVNGIFWDAGDLTFDVLPDTWSKTWLEKVIPLLDVTINPFEVGNEFPEKALHMRVRDVVRAIEPHALVQVNRNEDTPGQYSNMKIGSEYAVIAFHGRRLQRPSDLDRLYPNELTYLTFRAFFDRAPHDPSRIIFSSDGARASNDPIETYDWGPLREFVQDVRRRGCSFEHQSRAKMSPHPNYHMIEAEWFKTLRN